MIPEHASLLVASRLIPDLDGGFTVSVMRRARDIAAATGRDPLLLTVDPGESAAHDAHRAEWVARGLLPRPDLLRNLFDDARTDATWLRAAAHPLPVPGADASGAARADAGAPEGSVTGAAASGAGSGAAGSSAAGPGAAAPVDAGPGAAAHPLPVPGAAEPGAAGPGASAPEGSVPDAVVYRPIAAADGRTVLELPYVTGADWHLSEAPVRVWDAAGEAPMGWLPGYRGLYGAWVDAVVAAEEASTALPAVVVCEARQIGELLVADGIPSYPLLHTTHACHVRAPFTWDAPMDAAWGRWLGIADRFDGVLWLTSAQQRDVERRVGGGIRSFVVPHPAPPVAPIAEPVSGRVVMLNSLIPRKRMDDALRALAAVPEATLEVYGGGAERERLERLADELGIADRVRWNGHAPDPELAWRGADAFLFTSTNEGQGLVLLEALAHGVPVVAYDVPYGPADTLSDGGGTLVPDGDVGALAAALRRVVTDRDLRERMSADGRRSAAGRDAAASMRAFGEAVAAALAAH